MRIYCVSAHLLLIHKIEDKTKKIYPCPHCDYKAIVKSRLEKHIKVHTDTRNYACDQCGKMFKTEKTLSVHNEWLHSNNKYSCRFCPYVTKTTRRLELHISIQHKFKGMKPHQCPYCDFTCATNGNTRKHIMKRHPGQEVRVVRNEEMLKYMKNVRKTEAADWEMVNQGEIVP